MERLLRIVLCVVAGAACAVGGELPREIHSRSGIVHDLFGAQRSDLPRPEAPLFQQESGGGKKSVGLAVVYSLLLPGMGEVYAGNFATGKYFLIGEGALWLTFATFEVYGNALRDDARAYAVSHAGISTSDKDDQFYVNLGNFIDVNQYNDKKLRDREPENLYYPNTGHDWRWDSDASRAAFRSQRIASETMYNNKKFVGAALLINHVASAINAARSVISHNKEIEDQMGELHISADVMGGLAHPHGIMLTFTRVF